MGSSLQIMQEKDEREKVEGECQGSLKMCFQNMLNNLDRTYYAKEETLKIPSKMSPDIEITN